MAEIPMSVKATVVLDKAKAMRELEEIKSKAAKLAQGGKTTGPTAGPVGPSQQTSPQQSAGPAMSQPSNTPSGPAPKTLGQSIAQMVKNQVAQVLGQAGGPVGNILGQGVQALGTTPKGGGSSAFLAGLANTVKLMAVLKATEQGTNILSGMLQGAASIGTKTAQNIASAQGEALEGISNFLTEGFHYAFDTIPGALSGAERAKQLLTIQGMMGKSPNAADVYDASTRLIGNYMRRRLAERMRSKLESEFAGRAYGQGLSEAVRDLLSGGLRR